jgi:hypothetical protein
MENDRFKSLHRGYFEIDEASLRSLELSMSGHVAFEVYPDLDDPRYEKLRTIIITETDVEDI